MGYVSFGLVFLALLGLIGFTWWALRKIRGCPVLQFFFPNLAKYFVLKGFKESGSLIFGLSPSLGAPCHPQ
jgi:hypothetical protein